MARLSLEHAWWELKLKANKPPKAREYAGDHVVISFSVKSDWLREWRELSGPSQSEVSEVKPMQYRITFDT